MTMKKSRLLTAIMFADMVGYTVCRKMSKKLKKTGTGEKAAFNIAILYAVMDKLDEMYHYLKKSAENMDNSVTYILVYPSFKKYHQDPRFVEIVKKIGLWK